MNCTNCNTPTRFLEQAVALKCDYCGWSGPLPNGTFRVTINHSSGGAATYNALHQAAGQPANLITERDKLWLGKLNVRAPVNNHRLVPPS